MVTAKVAFDYTAEQPDELTLKVGEIITKVDQQDGGWWEGEVDGRRGMFPENFVEVIAEEPQAALTSTLATQSGLKKARVTFQYTPEQPDELSLEVGEVLDVLDNDDEGWWKGRIGNREGVFPSNFVELIKEDSVKTPTLPEPLVPVPLSPSQEDQPDAPGGGGGIKGNRPKSQMGFGITLGDLSRNKLKKTGKGSEQPKKPDLPAPPPTHETAEKRPAAPPPAASTAATKTMVTKSVQKARVTFAYEPEQEDELKLSVGEVVVITNKEVFEGWMQGEVNGKKGLFPDNFVELLPLENVAVDSSVELPGKEIQQQKSVKRAAKEDPSPHAPPPSQDKPTAEKPQSALDKPTAEKPQSALDKPKPVTSPLFSPGGNPLKNELEKKLAGGVRPPPPGKPKPTKPGPPAKPMKPKVSAPPPQAKRPTPPPAAAKLSSPPPVVKNISNSNSMTRSSSVSGKPIPSGPTLPRTHSTSSPRNTIPPPKTEPEEPAGELDLDVVKASDPLKHMQRVKPPSKHPPSKFKASDDDVADGGPSHDTGDSKQVMELKTEVNDLQTKMSEMEKKFKILFKQVQDELDTERKNRMNQQVEIDRLKRQLELLEGH